MSHLLDVNALIALVHQGHQHHAPMRRWLAGLQKKGRPRLGTCAITEIGFLRVSVQAGLLPDLANARAALAAFKGSTACDFIFLADDVGGDRLPGFVTKPAQLTDGHLLELASAHHSQLVTLDAGIPGAVLIK